MFVVWLCEKWYSCRRLFCMFAPSHVSFVWEIYIKKKKEEEENDRLFFILVSLRTDFVTHVEGMTGTWAS